MREASFVKANMPTGKLERKVLRGEGKKSTSLEAEVEVW